MSVKKQRMSHPTAPQSILGRLTLAVAVSLIAACVQVPKEDRLLNSGVIRIVSKGQMLDQALDSVAQLALLNSIGKFPEPT